MSAEHVLTMLNEHEVKLSRRVKVCPLNTY